jgi:hypothetical protein
MNNKPSHTDRSIHDELRVFVQELLNDGFGAAEISFCLAEASAGLGLDVAPDPEIAITVVLDGIRAACTARSASVQSQRDQLDAEQGCPANMTIH